MEKCTNGHPEIIFDNVAGRCPSCATNQAVEVLRDQNEELSVRATAQAVELGELRAAAKPSPYKKRYVLGEGIPTAGCGENDGCDDVWLRSSPNQAGRKMLQWPAELEGDRRGQPKDLPPYRLVLELVEPHP